MKFKIIGATPTGENLCRTCRSGFRRLTESGKETIRCTMIDENMIEPVVECSNYNDRRLPYLSEMRQIAWYVAVDKKGNRIGFVTKEALTRLQEDGIARKEEEPF